MSEEPTLQRGSHEGAVGELQTHLQTFGYYNGQLDNIFGPETEQAVLAFQGAAQIAVDGIVGPETWGALLASRRYDFTEEEADVITADPPYFPSTPYEEEMN